MEDPIPLPIQPVEPDVSATPVAVQIDPAGVFEMAAEQAERADDIMWAVPPNTLVFRSHTGTPRVPGSAHRHRLQHPEPVGATAYYISNSDKPPIPFGVSIDGNASAAETRRWPEERGRLAVAVTGTVTVAAHPDDISKLNVGDRLAVDHTIGPHTGGFVGYEGFQIPRIIEFSKTGELKEVEDKLRNPALPDDARRALLQKHKALAPFGVALELGFCEMRVLLTP